jgi:hypothetical protein
MTNDPIRLHPTRPLPRWRTEFERIHLWNPAAVRSSTPQRYYRLARSNLADD